MSETVKDTKAAKKDGQDKAAVTRPDQGDPAPGKTHVTAQGGTTIKTRW